MNARHAAEAVSQVIRRGETEMADLVERLDLPRASAALGDHQRPDRCDVAVAGLARTLRSPGQPSAGGFDRVGGIGLAGPTSRLAVRAVDLDHLDARRAQEPREAGTVGAGALYTDTCDRSERAQPTEELVVAGCGGLEALDTQQPADVIQRGSDVDVEMRVDAARDRTRAFYDGHRHPFSR